MLKYRSVQSYLAALDEDYSLAVISKAMAAKNLGVGAPTIDRMLEDERLTGIMVEGTTCVRASKLIDMAEEDKKRMEKVQGLLVKLARKGKHAFYSHVMDPIQLSTKSPPDRKTIARILGAISKKTYEDHGILLTVLIHKKTAGKTGPSEGFFSLADFLGIEYGDRDDFVRKQTHLVYDFYRP